MPDDNTRTTDRWDVRREAWSGPGLGAALRDGWEPFSVTKGNLDDYVWLRRRVS